MEKITLPIKLSTFDNLRLEELNAMKIAIDLWFSNISYYAATQTENTFMLTQLRSVEEAIKQIQQKSSGQILSMK